MISNFFFSAAGGYQINQSLRFNSADSAYLDRNFSAGNRKTFTFSTWVKLCNTNNTQNFLNAGNNSTVGRSIFRYHAQKFDLIASAVGGTTAALVTTDAVFRDFSAWYHLLWAVDTTQAISTDRVKMWVNGVSQSLTFTTAPALDGIFSINHNSAHRIGGAVYTSGQFPDYYLADCYFIDGQALAATDFGEFDAITGAWIPKKYSGTYGTNGFYLDFADNSSAAALGYDAAGSNDWTVNNLSVTAGAGNDSLRDSPTNGTQTDTGAGGEVSGNYATLNPLWFYYTSNTGSLQNGNLEYVGPSSAWGSRYSTIGVSSGKWYFEASATTSSPTFMVGVVTEASSQHVGITGYAYYQNGNKYNYNSATTYGATYTTGDAIGVALDLDAGEITFYKNGVSQGVAFSSISGTFFPGISCYATTGYVNFGQRAFAYTPPTGYKALSTGNLPEPTIKNGSDYLSVNTYTGTGSAQTITTDFQSDFIWIKRRNSALNHAWVDSERGLDKILRSNTTTSPRGQITDAQVVTSITSTGFVVGTSSLSNNSSDTYVAWAWPKSAVGGFDVLTYTGTGSARTVSHSLGVKPAFIAIKEYASNGSWVCYHKELGATKAISIENTNAAYTSSGNFNNTEPTDTVFTVGTANDTNGNGLGFIAYLWSEVAGYSKFGSYTGNGSSDGPFVACNFRPRWVLTKCTDSTSAWYIHDAVRNTYNVCNNALSPDLADAEVTANNNVDILSNGFKLRTTGAWMNASGGTYVFAAFSETAFKFANAR